MKKIVLILFLISVFPAPLAGAHPFTQDTIPSQSSNAPIGTSQVIVFYSEDLEIEFSSLKVFDSNGNQIDNRDTGYYENEKSLVVTVPPLEEGVYTVASKVLSRIDGHLVPNAFVFGVGDVVVSDIDVPNSELIFYPEAAAKFPGLVGQAIVLGAIIASILIWRTLRKDFMGTDADTLQSTYQNKFFSIIGIGIIAVFASNILVLSIQTLRLETLPIEALQTSFGTVWTIRMASIAALIVTWVILGKRKNLSIKSQILILVISLVLIGTTTVTGHGTASGQLGAIVLDYVHNLVAATWIGGVIFLTFALLPSFSGLRENYREKISLLIIPRFSIMITVVLGIVIISGPILMWFLESNLNTITESTYGKLIIAKILIAAVMISIGAYHQFGIQRRAEKNLGGKIIVHKKLKRALKIESVLGIILLGVVALLTSSTLPSGEIQGADAQGASYGLSTVEFSESTVFHIDIFPFTSGSNTINVKVTDYNGKLISDLDAVKIKIANPEKNIAPIEIEMVRGNNKTTDEFEGNGTFGFSGNWLVEIEAQKTESVSEAIALNLLVKPRLENLRMDLIEYDLPVDGKPLYPIYDGNGAVWTSDISGPVLWKFTVDQEKFESFSFEGQASQGLVIDHDGKIWFTDIAEHRIGYLDPKTQLTQIIEFPEITPYTVDSIPITLEVDKENNIWISILTKGVLLKYNQDSKEFEEYRLPNQQGGPFDVIEDELGMIWFTESNTGTIGTINPHTKEIKEIPLDTTLKSPEAFVFDNTGNLWIAEHSGAGIAKYNTILNTLERIPVFNADSLPFGMAFDRYGNVWFAQHQIDFLGVYDPHNNDMIEVTIPTETSYVQFITADDDGNIWFAENEGGKLGVIKITEIPTQGTVKKTKESKQIQYTELASPLIALGIIASSLFFVKGVKDKRRLDEKILSTSG